MINLKIYRIKKAAKETYLILHFIKQFMSMGLAFHQAPHVGTCANTVVGASLPGATMEVCLLLVMLDDTAAEVACTRNQEADQFLGNQRINQRDAKDG